MGLLWMPTGANEREKEGEGGEVERNGGERTVSDEIRRVGVPRVGEIPLEAAVCSDFLRFAKNSDVCCFCFRFGC